MLISVYHYPVYKVQGLVHYFHGKEGNINSIYIYNASQLMW